MDHGPLQPATRPGAFPFLSPAQKPDELGRLGPFRVLAELGRGGMGIVFRAEEVALKRQVALKVMLPEIAADSRAVGRFRHEAEAQAKVEHDHIVTIFRVGSANGVAFIAMPLLKGQTLAQALKQSPRPPLAELVRVGREVAEGLAAAHAVGLIHRDIKPANIWLEAPKRRVKILDFGLARNTDAPAPVDGDTPANPPTASGALMGTPAYMSPEQAQSRPTDFRTDLFSLGAVLYQMASGKMPFTGSSSFAVMTAVVTREPPAVQELAPEVPPALSDLIRRLVAKNPADRPASARAVAEELEAIEHDSATMTVPIAPPVVAAGEPDPWVGIDTINPDAVTVVQGSRAEPLARPATNPAWLKPAVAGGVLLAIALAAVAAVAVWPRSEPPRDPRKGAEKPPERPGPVRPPDSKDKDKPLATPDRLAAEALAGHADLVVRRANGHETVVKKGDRLPTDPFVVTGIELVGGDFPPDFVDRVFLPATEQLRSLSVVSGWSGRMPELTEAQLARLGAQPAGATLTELKIAPGPKLTPGTLDALKPFPNLKSVSLNAAGADDAALRRLADLKLTDFLGLTNLGASAGVTDAGLGAVAQLPVRRLTLATSPGAPGVLRLLPDGAQYDEINLWGSPAVADADLRALARPQSVKRLVLRGTKVTDAGLEHLRAVRGLASVDLCGTGVTASGVAKLKADRPDCRVEWDEPAPKK